MKIATFVFSVLAFACSAATLAVVGVALKRGKTEMDQFRTKANNTLQKARDALTDLEV